jgi:hypothetical protein
MKDRRGFLLVLGGCGLRWLTVYLLGVQIQATNVAPSVKKPSIPRRIKGLHDWWRFRDSNPGPADYDSVALTD